MTDIACAVAVERLNGDRILIVPSDSDTAYFLRKPGKNTRWKFVEEVGDGVTSRGPVAVRMTDGDFDAISDSGWSTTLGQKTLRALDACTGVTSTLPIDHLFKLADEIPQNDLISEWIIDGRTKRTPAEEAPAVEAMVEDAAPVVVATSESGADAPDAALWDAYVPRKIAKGVTDIDMLDYAMKNHEAVLLTGPSGSGKSQAGVAYAAKNGLPCYCVSGNVALEPSHLFGKYTPTSDGRFQWTSGPVTELVRHGGVLVLDEINAISPKILTVLYPLLDFRREVTLLDHHGEVVKAHPNLLIVATGNLGYHGTMPMSEALLDRFEHQHDWGYSDAVEKKLLKSRQLRQLAESVRDDGSMQSPLSTRKLIVFERQALSGLGWDYAVNNLLGRFHVDEDRDALRALLDLHDAAIKVDLGLAPAPEPAEEKTPDTANEDDLLDAMTWAEIIKTL